MQHHRLHDHILWREYAEHNEYIRHAMQWTVGWYTFFITANLLATGWFVTSGATVRNDNAVLFLLICTTFMAVNVIGIMALRLVGHYMKRTNNRVNSILLEIVGDSSAEEVAQRIKSPIPILEIRRTVLLMSASIALLLATWAVYGVLVGFIIPVSPS